MTRRCRLHIIGFMALLASLLAACSSNADTTPLDVPVHLLRNGDLALRCGTSLESHVVVGVNGENGPYSHIGIVVQIDGQWYVAHAVPGENERGEPEYVKLDPIQVYYGRDRAKLGCIMRVTDDSTVCRQATDYAQWAVAPKKCLTTIMTGKTPPNSTAPRWCKGPISMPASTWPKTATLVLSPP